MVCFTFVAYKKTIARQIYFDCSTIAAYLFVKINFHPVIFAGKGTNAKGSTPLKLNCNIQPGSKNKKNFK